MQRIIVLAGQKGHGKDTAASALLNRGFTRAPLAGALKEMLGALLRWQNCDDESVRRQLEGDQKELGMGGLDGRTPRHAMQTLGTEWGRELIAPNFWLNVWSRHNMGCGDLVVPDCRFENEAKFLKYYGAEIFVIRRPGFTKPAEHASEDLSWAEGYPIIWNDGTVEKLHAEVLAAVKP